MKPISTPQLAVDAAAVAAVSAGVLALADRPAVMWLLLVAVLLARFAAFRATHPDRSLAAEVAFFALCTVVGAVNDLNTVVAHGVYRYEATAELPTVSSIPLWMLVFWGLILRFVFAITRWRALGPPEVPARRVLGRAGRGRQLVLLVCIVVSTRLALYAWYAHPIASWLPFLAGLAVFALAGRADRHDARLAGLALVAGPIAEALFIEVGGLHAYALGWLFGVPLWIVLWWALAIWIWKDVGAWAYAGLERALGASEGSRTSPA